MTDGRGRTWRSLSAKLLLATLLSLLLALMTYAVVSRVAQVFVDRYYMSASSSASRKAAIYTELNRFIINKRVYARNTLSVSFAVLRSNGENVSDVDENTTKCYFDPHDTIFDVARRMNEVIEEARKPDADNATMRIASALLKSPIARPAVSVLKWMDRHGMMPRFIIDASPFHTSLFLTNNASVGLPAVFHHIYNFGSTTMFWSMGAPRKKIDLDRDGKPIRARIMPIGVTVDERVAAGRVFGMMIARMMRYFSDPSLLEQPPEKVNLDEEHEVKVPAQG